MNEQNYKIIKSIISKNEKSIYLLSSSNKTIDEQTAVTYNISVANCSVTSTVEDVATNIDQCIELLEKLSANSITTENFKNYIIDYLSEH